MSTVDPSAANLFLGKIVNGRFQIERLVGQGSFAWVFLGRTEQGQPVAVKLLHSTEPTASLRFAREIEVLKALPANPNVVGYLDDGHTADGWPLLVIEYVDGITLKDGITTAKRLAPAKAVAFMAELCQAFVGIHQLGVAHRDVKPENILLARSGGIKLIDFGLIRDAQGLLKLLEEQDVLDKHVFSDELDNRILVGTPEYMAPEQFSDASMEDLAHGRTDTWSDVFSLGVIFYQLLAGAKPFPMANVTAEQYPREILNYMRWRIHLKEHEVPPCPGIDKALSSVLRKALRQDPRRRQPDARAFMDDLQRYTTTGEGVAKTDDSRTLAVSVDPMAFLPSILAPGAPDETTDVESQPLPALITDEDEGSTLVTSADSTEDIETSDGDEHTVIFFDAFNRLVAPGGQASDDDFDDAATIAPSESGVVRAALPGESGVVRAAPVYVVDQNEDWADATTPDASSQTREVLDSVQDFGGDPPPGLGEHGTTVSPAPILPTPLPQDGPPSPIPQGAHTPIPSPVPGGVYTPIPQPVPSPIPQALEPESREPSAPEKQKTRRRRKSGTAPGKAKKASIFDQATRKVHVDEILGREKTRRVDAADLDPEGGGGPTTPER